MCSDNKCVNCVAAVSTDNDRILLRVRYKRIKRTICILYHVFTKYAASADF